MTKKNGKSRRAALVIFLGVVLTAAAVALGGLWAVYRAYPYEHRAAIEECAALYGQDPLWVAAVIRTESSWRPNAVSGVGATGLMQIMPETGSWIAGKNGWEYADELLTDPVYNIRLGCWYLDYLARRFGGDRTRILAAYNAGENKVGQWVSEGLFDEGRAEIPYAETRSFVRKVMDAYEKYQFLY